MSTSLATSLGQVCVDPSLHPIDPLHSPDIACGTMQVYAYIDQLEVILDNDASSTLAANTEDDALRTQASTTAEAA